MTYKIALFPTEEGFSASVPGLPGCWSEGKTEQETLTNIHDAIQEYLTVAQDLSEAGLMREIEVAV